MLPPDRASLFASAPIEDMLSILLRQMKRPLASHGVQLTDAEANRLAKARAAGEQAEFPGLLPALANIVAESEGVLSRLGLSFIDSLATPMDKIPGWETTADFLEIANEKSNAELRITLGSALALVFGGERRFVPYLLHLAAGDYADETAVARRALCFAAGVDAAAPDALAQVKRWLETPA